MIYGIGTDITKVERFKKWLKNDELYKRFFNEKEFMVDGSENARIQHFAVRFAAKEAFSKALGTGICGFKLKDVYVQNNEEGKPYLVVEKSAKELLEKRCGNCNLHLSLSHEKEYAIAFVVIEKVL